MRPTEVVLLAVVLGGLFVFPLHAPPICSRGEAREALVVRDIVAHGHWIIGYRDGALASKPPFFHWIAALAALGFGPSDAVMRLPSAIGTLVILGATLFLGTRIGGRRTGWLATAILAAMPYFWTSALEARVDMVFAAAITAELAAFFVGERDGGVGPALVCGAAGAAAILTKGPAGFALPVAVMLAHLAIERRLPHGFSRSAWPLAAALLVAALWYVAAYRTAGTALVEVQVVRENVDRVLGLGAFHRHLLRALRLPGAFGTHLFPWNVVLVWSAWRWWRGRREDAAGHFLHAWWMATLVMFAVAARTRSVYLLPALPAVALLAARALATVAGWLLVPATAAVALALLGVTHMHRVSAAEREPLLPFAARVRPLVGERTELRAAAGLPEGDTLVLRYLLHHSIRRGPLACAPDVLVLAPRAGERAAALGLHPIAEAGDGTPAIVLLQCGAPGRPPARGGGGASRGTPREPGADARRPSYAEPGERRSGARGPAAAARATPATARR